MANDTREDVLKAMKEVETRGQSTVGPTAPRTQKMPAANGARRRKSTPGSFDEGVDELNDKAARRGFDEEAANGARRRKSTPGSFDEGVDELNDKAARRGFDEEAANINKGK